VARRSSGRILKRTAKDGTISWRLGWELPPAPDPATGRLKRQYAYRTVKGGTKKDAQLELNRILASFRENAYVAPSRQTVEQCCADWLQSRQDLKKLRANTYHGYSEHIRRHIVPRLGAIELQKITSGHIQEFYGWLLREGGLKRAPKVAGEKQPPQPRGLAPQTVVHIHRTLSQVLKQARSQRPPRLAFDPLEGVELPRVGADARDAEDGTEKIKVLDEKQLAKLLAGFAGHRLETVALLAARTGMRRGELIALRWCDIDVANSVARVEWTVVDGGRLASPRLTFARPKTKRSRRAVALGAAAIAELETWRKRQAEDALKLGRQLRRDSEDLVFPYSIAEPRRPINPRYVTSEFIKRARKLGFEGLRFHDLRHCHATLLLKSGVNLKVVSERLGHANPSITLNVYQHVLPGMQEAAAAKMDELLKI
jgi:integrase